MVQCYPWLQGTLWNEHNIEDLIHSNGLSHLTLRPTGMGCNPDSEEVSNKLPFDICKTLQPAVLLQCLDRGDQQWPTDNKSNYSISGMMISSGITGLWECMYNEKWSV